MTAAEALTRALEGRWHGASGIARCPGHDDATPSLSIADGDEGRLLLQCFAGCAFEHIAAVLTRGGAVRLAEGQERLVVAEGLETALSLASGLVRGSVSVWAALSASGLSALHLPSRPGRLLIAADGDAIGQNAAEALAHRATADGWDVAIATAPEGQDWNDVLRARVSAS